MASWAFFPVEKVIPWRSLAGHLVTALEAMKCTKTFLKVVGK